MTHKICFKAATKQISVLPLASDTPEGFINIGDYTHDTENDPLGAPGSHVLFHHIQKALYPLGVQDMAYIDISFTAEVDAPPITCEFVLTVVPPYLTPDITGMTVSKTTVTAAGGDEQYIAASTPAAFWETGTRFVEGTLDTRTGVTGGASQASIILATDTGNFALIGYIGGDTWVVSLSSMGSSIGSTSVAGNAASIPALGVDPITRNVVAYLNGIPITTGPFAAEGVPEGFLTGTNVRIGIALAFQSNGTQQMTLVPGQAAMIHSYPGNDWCGIAIP